jgi:hypothetical protein
MRAAISIAERRRLIMRPAQVRSKCVQRSRGRDGVAGGGAGDTGLRYPPAPGAINIVERPSRAAMASPILARWNSPT